MKATFILTIWFLLLASESTSAQSIHCSRSIDSILVKPFTYEIIGDIFVTEKTVWKQEATIFIDSVVAFLIDSPFYWLEVRASPDQKTPSKHSRLGMAREQAICDYMITRGVSPDQVVPMGYGTSLQQPPVSKNANNDETQDKIVFAIIGNRKK